MKKIFSVPFVVGLLVIFAGTFLITYFNLYHNYPHLDKALHVAGGFIVAWFFGRYWKDNFKGFGDVDRFFILIGMAAFIGFAWEVMEFSTSLSPFVHHQLLRHYIYGGNLIDTLGDLMADCFGAAMYGFLTRK